MPSTIPKRCYIRDAINRHMLTCAIESYERALRYTREGIADGRVTYRQLLPLATRLENAAAELRDWAHSGPAAE